MRDTYAEEIYKATAYFQYIMKKFKKKNFGRKPNQWYVEQM